MCVLPNFQLFFHCHYSGSLIVGSTFTHKLHNMLFHMINEIHLINTYIYYQHCICITITLQQWFWSHNITTPTQKLLPYEPYNILYATTTLIHHHNHGHTTVPDGTHKWDCATEVLHWPADDQEPPSDAGGLIWVWEISFAQWEAQLTARGVCSLQRTFQLLHNLGYFQYHPWLHLHSVKMYEYFFMFFVCSTALQQESNKNQLTNLLWYYPQSCCRGSWKSPWRRRLAETMLLQATKSLYISLMTSTCQWFVAARKFKQ